MEPPTPRADPAISARPRSRRRRAAFVASAAVALSLLAATVYLGIGPFARSPAPPGGNGGGDGGGTNPCAGATSFSIVAGPGGTLTFNGTTPGPAMMVPDQTSICVKVTVDPASGITHSFKIVASGGGASSPTAFAGANTTDPMVGLQPGTSQTIRFVASPAGTYRYLCGVDAHASTMWGYFNVSA